ncbi:WD domain G-beta repeat [Carpediemonas membranifera]|uniref:WD domain G-beta repeat n=1 Tax=Carpediemonas membranifera TaxID=201153 RepID=A0A8J6EAU5_9EUKA|nr:WD domain G-beta repeat [Carpediemonas membranifera]|eukprot:KAG9395395.1 WD domain G-beta repeat [Carpediemonas membranifera]
MRNDGMLIAGNGDGSVFLVELEPSVTTTRYYGHVKPISSISLHPTENIFATCTPASVRIWEASAHSTYNSIGQSNENAGISVSFASTGLVFATASKSGRITFFRTADAKIIRTFDLEYTVLDMTLTNDDQYLVLLTPEAIIYYDYDNMAESITLPLRGKASSFNVSSNGNVIAALTSQGVFAFDIRYSHNAVAHHTPTSPECVAAHDSGAICVGTESGVVYLYDDPKQKPLKIEAHDCSVTAIAFSESRLATSGGGLAVWSLYDEEALVVQQKTGMELNNVPDDMVTLVSRLKGVSDSLQIVAEASDILMQRLDVIEARLEAKGL